MASNMSTLFKAMNQKPPIDITFEHWKMVKEILEKNVLEYDVYAFGSRVTGKARAYSDLDLAVMTEQPLSLGKYASLRDDFSESDLPWKVDIINPNKASHHSIEGEKVLLQQGTKNSYLLLSIQ
jgi:type I restriction enzyme S subunit